MIGKDKLVLDVTALSESDNVGAYLRANDGTLITHTLVGAKEGLDVYIINDATTPASTMDASDYAEDSAHVSGDIGSFALAVRNDANTSLVDADGDYAPLQVNSLGRLKVDAELSASFDFVYPEDSAHVSGDNGAYVLAVQQATLASSVSADGDYASFKLNDRGGLWSVPVGTVADDAADTENPVKVGSRARIGALAAISADGDRANLISDRYRRAYVNNGANVSALAQQVDVTTTAAVLLASNLSGRRSWLIQNLGNRAIYIGHDAAVTVSGATGGVRIASNGNMEIQLGEDVSLYAITDSGTQDVRLLELA